MMGIEIVSMIRYCIFVIVFSAIIRAVLTFLKIPAVMHGEADEEEGGRKFSEEWKEKRRIEKYRILFFCQGNHSNLDDYFIPTIIGSLEMFIFPILMVLGQWIFISTWLGLKAAVHWTKWQKSRTTYNRYLLGTILNVIISYAVLTKFIQKIS